MVQVNRPRLPKLSPVLASVARGCAAAAAGVLVMAAVVRSCSASARVDQLERRVARVETAVGIGDAGGIPSADTLVAESEAEGGAPSDEKTAACAVARVAAYQAWQDAVSKAKSVAGPAQAACADVWSDKKKQACYYAASAGARAAQAARDAVMGNDGGVASDAVKGVKDDPKNDAIGRARAASESVLALCWDMRQ
jgi:hypothetical protein